MDTVETGNTPRSKHKIKGKEIIKYPGRSITQENDHR